MFWEGVTDQVMGVSLVEEYGAVIACEISTGLAVDLELFSWMLWAVHDLLSWRDQVGGLLLNIIDASYLVACKLFPDLVEFSALVTHKLTTIMTVACC